MAKVHWNKSVSTSLCGLNTVSVNVEFTSNGTDVTCERCRKLLPLVRRTAWDLLIDEEKPNEEPVEPEKPKRVRKAKLKTSPAEPSLTEEELLSAARDGIRAGFRDVQPTRREEAMQSGFRMVYGDERMLVGSDRVPLSPAIWVYARAILLRVVASAVIISSLTVLLWYLLK